MATVESKYEFLERDSKSSYKQLFVKGRRIRALTLYSAYVSDEEPRSMEEIAGDYELPIQAVKEAIAYCESDPIEIREGIARQDALMEASGMNDPNYKFNPSPKPLSPLEIARIHRDVEDKFRREAKSSGTWAVS